MQKINRVGHRFGMLLVKQHAGVRRYKTGTQNLWLCLCDCGKVCTRVERALVTPAETHSCGCASQRTRPNYGRGSFNALRNGYQIRARKAGRAFTLTDEAFKQLVTADCHYCGTPPAQVITNNRCAPFVYNGIDRVDNAKGYEGANVRTCCGMCNTAKSDHTEQVFFAWIKRVHARVCV